MADTVLCTSTHPVDLNDGRVLAPGDTAEGIDVYLPHNAALIADGHLIIFTTPSTAKTVDDAVADTTDKGVSNA